VVTKRKITGVKEIFGGWVYRVDWQQEFTHPNDPGTTTYIGMGHTLVAKDELDAYQKVSQLLLDIASREEP
jgi:hypothetical protein